MSGIVSKSSTRIGSRGLVGLGGCVATLLVALILAGAAHAAEPTGVETHEPPASEQAATVPPAEPIVAEPAKPPPAEEPATPPASEPVPVETPAPPPAEPVTEEPATPPATEPVPVETPGLPPTEPVPVETPAPPPVAPVVEDPVTPPASERVAEEAVAPAAAELVAEETSTHTASPAAIAPHPPAAPVEGEGEVEDGDPPEVLGALVASPAIASQIEPTVAPSTPAPARSSRGGAAGALGGQVADNLSCALSGLGGVQTGSCGAAWLGAQSFLSPPTGGLVDATVASQAPTADAPDDVDHGGSTADFHPAGQAPGPSPGGASGGSAVGGSAGCSSCLTLAGLRRLGGPRAMRRLRLSCEHWLTACFVLIPERPG